MTSIHYVAQVTDIADAAILTQLFEGMWAAQSGCCVVSTSNRPPSELYKDGLNRHVFMPKFEALLNRNCRVVDINTADVDGDLERGTAVDYRMMGSEEQGLYLHPHDDRAEGAIESLFHALSEGRGSQPKVEVLSVPPGRSLTVHRSGPGSARFSFEELFLRPLGPSDYATIAKRCVSFVPRTFPDKGSSKDGHSFLFASQLSTLHGERATLSGTQTPNPKH